MPENISLMKSLLQNVWAMSTILILIICSVVSIYFIVERSLRYRQAKVDVTLLLAKLKKFLRKDGKFDKTGLPEAIILCRETRGPVSAVLKTGLMKYGWTKEEVEDNMKKTALEELSRLEQNLIIIGTIGSVALFIGLLGTVIGITESFRSLSTSGGINTVGPGIAQALISTIVGLFVAIPAVIGYNFLTNVVNRFSTEITTSSVELINIIFGKDIDRDKLEELLKEIRE